MGKKVKEIEKATAGGNGCRPDKGGCCSVHRRQNRVYEDQVWRFANRNPDTSPWRDPDNRPAGESDFR